MGMDVRIRRERERRCPQCDDIIGYDIVEEEYSSGREAWRTILQNIGYYKYDENRECYWYGKDMVLSDDQLDVILQLLSSETECAKDIKHMIILAHHYKDRIVINADW